MSSRPYTVHVYEEEAELISKWTLDYPNIETGGDFFGLWLNETEVVIQAVLGPGQNCRRTATSFFQNEAYLSKVGGLLTRYEGLCNIGSWHSHHRMNLPEPSRGDQDTVWRHLPTPGRFLLLIANIKMTSDGPKVQMSFCLFESTDKGKKQTNMNCSILKGRSPIRANKAVMDEVANGAEVYSNSTSYQEPPAQPRITEVKNDLGERRMEGYRPEMNVQRRYGKQEKKRTPGYREQENSDFLQNDPNQGRRKHHRTHHRHHQNITCDGVVSYYRYKNYIQYRPSKAQDSAESLGYSLKFSYLPGGRQQVELYHYSHPVRKCEDCRDAVLTRAPDGRYFTEFNNTCSCIIL